MLLCRYEKESLDVDRIQRDSLSATLLKLIGKYEGRVEKEMQEMLHAKTEYDAVSNRIKELMCERADLNSRIIDLNKLKAEFEDELNRRELLLKSGLDNEASAEYRKLEAEQELLSRQLTETEEALRAARRVLCTTESAMQHLDKAESWATYDVWLSKGIISHMAKYEHLDNAQSDFDRLSSQLKDLQKELRDINLTNDSMPVGIDSTTRVIDFWFDNIFTDLNVREQIRGDLEQTRKLYGKIDRIADTLADNITAINKKNQEIEQSKNRIVTLFKE